MGMALRSPAPNGHPRYLVEDCHAGYLLTIKGNRASLHAAAITTGRDLVAAEPGHIAEERGHGRIDRWTTWATHTDPTVWARIGRRAPPAWRSSAATSSACWTAAQQGDRVRGHQPRRPDRGRDLRPAVLGDREPGAPAGQLAAADQAGCRPASRPRYAGRHTRPLQLARDLGSSTRPASSACQALPCPRGVRASRVAGRWRRRSAGDFGPKQARHDRKPGLRPAVGRKSRPVSALYRSCGHAAG
jgi:hypothetical protein